MSSENLKVSLPKFLQILSGSFPISNAMLLAKSIYKSLDTTEKLSQCTDSQLISLGITSKDDRQNILKAIRNAKLPTTLASPTNDNMKKNVRDIPDPVFQLEASTSSNTGSKRRAKSEISPQQSSKKRRKHRQGATDDYADGDNSDMLAKPFNTNNKFDFNETLDEPILRSKTTTSNRAPVMTAWATVVAERMGFQRDEALSIASVYTEMNAISKGVSLGHIDKRKAKALEAPVAGSQPFVELMGRRPLYRAKTDKWYALSEASPVEPSQAFGYISRAFRQTTPFVIGAMMLLAQSIPADEINRNAWGLYLTFRPSASGWGEKSEMRCQDILDLRPTASVLPKPTKAVVQNQSDEVEGSMVKPEAGSSKRSLTLEEYEALLDQEEAEYDDTEEAGSAVSPEDGNNNNE